VQGQIAKFHPRTQVDYGSGLQKAKVGEPDSDDPMNAKWLASAPTTVESDCNVEEEICVVGTTLHFVPFVVVHTAVVVPFDVVVLAMAKHRAEVMQDTLVTAAAAEGVTALVQVVPPLRD
jgi:hypothetical protein